MRAKKMDQKFQAGIKLMNTDGMVQDGAEILMELANLGHIDSIEQLVYIFLDQQDFDDAESYINCAKDPSTPIILYLKARLIEERDGKAAAMETFKAAAAAGNPNSISLLFDLAIKDNDLEVAKKYLDKLRGYDHLLSIMNEPKTFEALNQKLESRVQYFNQMAKLRAEDKVFTIAVGSDATNTFLEVRVYAYYDQQYVQNFGDDLIGAVEFCGSKDRGFEVIYVGDSWDLDTTDIIYRCKVNWSENKITISVNYEDYWFGELSDMYSAVEELIEKECDWELVNYFLAEDDEEDEDDEDDEDDSEISPENFILAGAFKCNSGRAYVGDPYDIEDYLKSSSREKDVWTTSTLGVPVLDFGNLATTLEKHGLVYVEEDDDGKITKAVISFDGEFSEAVRSEDLVVGNYLLVNSGCLMVGDPFFLDTWNTNKVDDLDPIESTDDFSIFGCSASRVSKSFAVLSGGKSVVFDSGKGDGMYYLSFFIKSPFEEKLTFGDLREEKGVPSGRLISKVVIDFITEVDMWKFAE
jgi:hypothetical protein